MNDLPTTGSVHWIGSAADPAQKAFRLVVTDRSNVMISGEIYESTGFRITGEPCEEELYLRFYMKWDACCHIWFGGESGPRKQQSGYLHLCGPEAWENHIWLMAELYRWAERAIPINKETSLCGDFQPRL